MSNKIDKTHTQINVWKTTKEMFAKVAEFKGKKNLAAYMHELAKSQVSIMRELQEETCTCGSKAYYGTDHDKSCDMYLPF